MEKQNFLNPFRTKLLNICFIAVSLLFVSSISIYFISKITTKPKPILDFSGTWEVCVDGICKKEVVPAIKDHPNPEARNYKHILYKNTFKTPKACTTERCALLFSEIDDAAEIRINGQLVAVHGGIGEDFVFSKHYPVMEAIDSKIFKKTNSIEVLVETAKIPQSGIRGELNGFFPYKEAKSYTFGRYVYDIYTPLAGALLMLALCLYTIRKLFRATKTRPDLQALAWALCSMALVMISSSNIPREFIPEWICAYGHFLIRHAMDWSLFYLAYVFYRQKFSGLAWMNWWVYFSVAVFISSLFIGQLFVSEFARENSGVIAPFVAMHILFPLRLVPYVLLFIGCLGDTREKKLGRYLSAGVVIALLSFQLADLMLFWGFRAGSYYIRYFPVLIGIFYASKIFEIYDEEMQNNVLDGENAKGYRRMGMQAAHDLKSPLLSLRHQIRKSPSINNKERDVISSSLDTISRIASTLEVDFQNQKEVFVSCILSKLCRSVVTEKRTELKDKVGLQINYICESDAEEATAFVDSIELKRVLSNLINNSLQAITLDMKGLITVTLSVKHKHALISVKDNGRGIAAERIPHMFKSGTTTRRDGRGLGLSHAKNTLKVLGGKIKLESKVGFGTEVLLYVPLENALGNNEKIIQNVISIPTAKTRTCVLVDDDQTVSEIWKDEALKAKINLIIFSHPREASTALVKLDKLNTDLYVDVNFGGEILGPAFAKKLKTLGFEKVTLSTAYPSAAFIELKNSGIQVSGKEPPWAS